MTSNNWQRLATIIATAVLGGCLVLFLTSSESVNTLNAATISVNANAALSSSLSSRKRHLAVECESQCKDPPFKDLQHFDGDDLLDPAKMLERFKRKRGEWVDTRLKNDYGETNYLNMFEPYEVVNGTKNDKVRVSVGRKRVFADPATLPKTKKPEQEDLDKKGDLAWGRLVRKFQMKILQIQIAMLDERTNAKAICLDECDTQDEEGSRRLLKVQPSTGLYSKFTWATGGHSASAGHGNLFRESYTANMDRALTPLFQSLGIEFEARNYAMGGTDSAEEVALCLNSIFGRDVDAISWDYGMTDGHELWKMALYAYKAAGISQVANSKSQPGNINHRPAFFALHQSSGNNLVVDTMSQLGMTALAFNQNYMENVILDAVPDMMGLNDKQISNQPPYVQYLKCDGRIEVGDPGCKENKFNMSLCTKRKAMTSWHPGWKYHALMGNLMSMTLLDATEDAIQGLMDQNAENPPPETESIEEHKNRLMKQLRTLDQGEKKDYKNIFDTPISEKLMPHIEKWWNGQRDEHLKDVDIEAFFKEPSFCHSAILPSQSRFQGLLTENFTHTGAILDQNYDVGVSSSILDRVERPGRRSPNEPAAYGDDDSLLLVKDDGGRQKCEEQLNLDYKDYFFVSALEGWRTLTLPNDSEKKEYVEFDGTKSKGYILACLVRCDWGNCPGGDLHNYFGWIEPKPRKGQDPPTKEEVAKMGKLEITVNGEKVTESSDMHTCYALKNKKGHVWKPNADGRYEIKMRINGGTDYSFIRISAFVLL